ncbi:MAG: PEGA domain-containing protein [Candidatus Hydrogenedentes bacterium]|nr:PEGA domain-containing protein [Candidatus Hydrogenedentota bacterium]
MRIKFSKKTCAFFLIMVALITSSAFSETTYRFDRLWPMLTQPWYFGSPAGIACDINGNVYIADSFNGRVQKFTTQGHFITMWNGGDGNAFVMPQDVAVDLDGNVYVLDSAACRVRVFSTTGEELVSWGEIGSSTGQFSQPQGIALDGYGNVYVADTGNHRVQIFDGEGVYLDVWGENEKNGYTLHEPTDLAFDSLGNVYVVDSGNDTVVLLNDEGVLSEVWGGTGAENGQFNHPARIIVNAENDVYVSDMDNFRIQQFNASGTFIRTWGSEGSGGGEFARPDGLALDKYGHLLISDSGWHDRIQVFTETGVFVTAWGSQYNGTNQFNGPTDVVADEANYVYVADFANSRIQKYSSAGRFIEFWGPEADESGYCMQPYSLALDSLHNLVYAYDLYDSQLRQYDLDGEYIREWNSLDGGTSGTAGFTRIAAHDGFLYTADSINHRVRKFSSTGVFVNEWGSFGFENGQFFSPFGVVVDDAGQVYVADTYNNRIQVFTSEGIFLRSWGTEGSNPGQFMLPVAVSVTADGSILVSDSDNNRIQQFTAQGEFVAQFGSVGAGPGQFNQPGGMAALGIDRIVVADTLNNRLQQFQAIDNAEQAKAVIVAGGGPISGNTLWDATRLCANFAYRTLIYSGYTKDDIYYLSPDSSVDLDNDGLANDVDADCTLAALEYALTSWIESADMLVVYLVDHGGITTFRMNETEILDASVLGGWIDVVRPLVAGNILLVDDSCHSGSFLPGFATMNYEPAITVITSTESEQSAYFLGTGTASFSSIFWMEILNGLDVDGAYRFAATTVQEIYALQTPQLDSNGNGIANESEDYAAVSEMYVGMTGASSANRPVIGSVSVPESSQGGKPVTITVSNIQSGEDIAQVWAVVRSPGGIGNIYNAPVLWLPTVPLDPVTTDVYAGEYDNFHIPGNYQFSIYARDISGRISVPITRTVTVESPLRRRAVLVAACTSDNPFWQATKKNTLLAYQALQFQGYSDEDIQFYCAEAIAPAVIGLPTVDNLQYAVTQWAATNTQDLVIYITGIGTSDYVELGPGETLFAPTVKGWLDELQQSLPGTVSFVCDFCSSGGFLPALAAGDNIERIVISGAGIDAAPSFDVVGDISFSRFFWRQILAGANLRSAFLYAANTLQFFDTSFEPCLDDTGDGIYQSSVDGRIAIETVLGIGLQYASDPPIIQSFSPPQVLDGKKTDHTTTAKIWVDTIASTAEIVSVFALITSPDYDPRDCGVSSQGNYVLLVEDEDGHYESIYDRFIYRGVYKIRIFAVDINGDISAPAITQVEQKSATVISDIYESDNTSETASWIGLGGTAQRHNFSQENDEDWARFFAYKDQMIVIETSYLGEAANTYIQLYREDEDLVLIAEDDDSNPEEFGASLIQWRADEEGFYLIRVTNVPPEVYSANAFYDLVVRDDTGATIAGAITVTVFNAATDAFLSDANVYLLDFGGMSNITSTQGVAYFPVLPIKTYTVVVEKEGFSNATSSVQVNSGQTVSLILTIQPIEGEGEPVEGESVEGEEMTGVLLEAFDDSDTDDNGLLSLEEVHVTLPELTQDQFNQLDDNGDGYLSREELGAEDYHCGFCHGNTGTKGDFKRYLGDWLLIGLSLLSLISLTRLASHK